MQDMPFDPDETNDANESNDANDTNDADAPNDTDEPEAEGDEPDTERDPEADEPDAPEPDDAEAGEPEAATLTAVTEPRETGPAVDPGDPLQSDRGFHAYALHCARCHGETLQGNVAPALGGPVFLERWGGHPVDWLYFQARAAMPPHGPGFLSEQTYADIIVYALTEAGVLEGFEEYRPDDEEFRTLVITPRVADEERPELDEMVETLRERLHAPHDEPEVPVADPISPIEWPDDPGASPIGPPGRIDAAIALESGAAPDPDAVPDEDTESDEAEPATDDPEEIEPDEPEPEFQPPPADPAPTAPGDEDENDDAEARPGPAITPQQAGA